MDSSDAITLEDYTPLALPLLEAEMGGLNTSDLPLMPDLGINPSITISSEFFQVFKGSGSIRGKNKGKCEHEDSKDE